MNYSILNLTLEKEVVRLPLSYVGTVKLIMTLHTDYPLHELLIPLL